MTYAEVVTLIETHATTALAGNGSFMYSNGQDQSQDYKGASRKAYMDYARSIPDFRNKNITFDVAIAFLDQDKPSSSPAERLAIHSTMHELGLQFLFLLFEDSYQIENAIIDPIDRKLSQVMTGVLVRFRLTDKLTNPRIC